MTDDAAGQRREAWTGALVTLGCTVLFGGIVPLFLAGVLVSLPLVNGLSVIGLAPLGVGVVQVAWVLPLYRKYEQEGKDARKKGVVIMAAITFLLNATCWGALATMLSNESFH